MTKAVSLREAWSGTANCRDCTLRTSALFAQLSETDFARLHEPIAQFQLAPGALLYHGGLSTGSAGHYLYTVRNGLLKLVRYLPDGAQRIVRLARPPDVLGLETLLGTCYQHDAIALQPTEVCRLSAAALRELEQTNPGLRQALMASWQQALDNADIWLTELSTGAARQRVARLLLRLLSCDGTPNHCRLISREDMGAILGVTTETASRTVAEFKRQHLLTDAGPHLFSLDTRRLRAIADG